MLRRLALLLALFPAALFARSYGDFDVAAVPGWVRSAPAATGFRVPADLARYGVYDILSDHQVRVRRDGQTSHYYRTVRKVLSASGVQNAAQLSVDYDPTFQRLIIHDVVIVRGGDSIDALDPSDVRVIEKEDESDDGIYDGRLTALLFLKGVRAGDVIDYSWTLEGANPILRGRYADEYDLGSTVPAHQLRHRLLWQPSRPIHFRTAAGDAAPAIESSADGTAYTWEAHDVHAADLEDRLPSWFDAWPVVEVSDFASWGEVARWSSAMFRPDAPSNAAVDTLAGRIRAEHAGDPVTGAIRFVQDDIRYLGIEIGRNSHQPRQPSEVLAQRWGDCKEKALLLALLLRRLGLQADAALVNTKARDSLGARVPSPFAFDHVVVRVVDGGKVYWVDPTLSQQGGTLANLDTPNDGRALLVRDDAAGLVRISTARRAQTVIEESFEVRDDASPVVLTVRSTYSGSDADQLRADLESMSASDIARERLNRYAADHPAITATTPPRVEDDRLRNVVTVTEKYSIRDLFRGGQLVYYPRAIQPFLEKPQTVVRSMPLAFDYPLDVTERAVFHFAGEPDAAQERFSRSTPAMQFVATVTPRGRDLQLEYSIRSLADCVAARDVARHLTAINDIEDELGLTVRRPGTAPGADRLRRVVRDSHPLLIWAWGAAALLACASIAAVAVALLRGHRAEGENAEGSTS